MRHGRQIHAVILANPAWKSGAVRTVVPGLVRTALVIFLWPNLQGAILQGQESRKTVDHLAAGDALVSSLNSEKDHGPYTFYRQAYVDTDNRKAVYTGSIYGSIAAFSVVGCIVNLEVAMIDHFSGTIDNRPTGEQQDSTSYTVTFPMNRAIAEKLTLLDARPLELTASTDATCTERPSCTFTWLEIRGSRGEIKETQVVNGILHFKGSAEHFMVPVSSVTSGNRLVQALRNLAHEKCP